MFLGFPGLKQLTKNGNGWSWNQAVHDFMFYIYFLCIIGIFNMGIRGKCWIPFDNSSKLFELFEELQHLVLLG